MSGSSFLPCSVDLNTFKAYIDLKNTKRSENKFLNALNLQWKQHEPKPLRLLVLDQIIENWHNNPVINQLPTQIDKLYLVDGIDVNIAIKVSSIHIREDVFWKRCFTNRWKHFNSNVEGREWIKIYMEKHLGEILEKMETYDYDQESIQEILDTCAPYVERLVINYLQPSMGDRPEHIPLDYVLTNLPELRRFDLTYSTKTIGTQYYLGCSWPTKSDIFCLGRGLQKCYELTEFRLHRTRLEPYMLRVLARGLDKGCTALQQLAITDCRFGDTGVVEFLNVLNKESFLNLKRLILDNNLLSQASAYLISKALKGRQIELLDLSLNPIGSDGAGAVFSSLDSFPIRALNISACSITESVTRMLLKLLIENKTLLEIELANNDLGYVLAVNITLAIYKFYLFLQSLGRNIYRVVGFNKIIKKLDLRNTGTTTEFRNKINEILFRNREKL